MWSGGTMVSAAAMTWRRSARPPISWRTLGRLLLSRVPLPAAMMAMANPLLSIGIWSHAWLGAQKRGGCVVWLLSHWPSFERDAELSRFCTPGMPAYSAVVGSIIDRTCEIW